MINTLSTLKQLVEYFAIYRKIVNQERTNEKEILIKAEIENNFFFVAKLLGQEGDYIRNAPQKSCSTDKDI